MPSPTSRNLKFYPGYVVGVSFYAWMPIFFLYFNQTVSLSDVLRLEAIYYISVFLFEVPSGYFSDRFGRKPTLILAALSLCVSFATFVLTSSFLGFALAQVCLALGLAMNSGTDTSFHLASLTEAGLQDEYDEREAKLSSWMFVTSALAALCGGALGVIDLRLAYVASSLGAILALGCALQFKETKKTPGREDAPQGSFLDTLRACWHDLKRPELAWLFVIAVGATVLNHLPYEFYQPYVKRLDSFSFLSDTYVPLVAGVHLALTQLIAAPIARQSAKLVRLLGPVLHLLLSNLLQVVLIGLMAWMVHPVIGLLLLGRAIPSGLQNAPIRAEVAPRVLSDHRATYLSLQSLMGRLGFAIMLFGLSLGSNPFETVLTHSLWASCGLLACLVVVTLVLRPKFKDREHPI